MGYMAPMIIKLWKYFLGPTSETNNLPLVIKVIIGMDGSCTDGSVAKIEFNGTHD